MLSTLARSIAPERWAPDKTTGSCSAEHATRRNVAKIAGVSYLIIIMAGIFAEFIIRSSIIEPGDAAATAANIRDSQGLFRLSIGSDLVMLIFDAVVAGALFFLIRPLSTGWAVAIAAFRLVHTAVYGVTLLTLTFAVQLTGGDAYLSAFSPEQLDALALLFAEAQGYGYVIGLVFFGVHVLLLGYVTLRTGALPQALALLLLVAGAGYLVDSFANILVSNYADYETVFALVVFVPAVIAEVTLALWLLMKGVDVSRRGEQPAAMQPPPARDARGPA